MNEDAINIVGGSLVGLVCGIALRRSHRNITIWDNKKPTTPMPNHPVTLRAQHLSFLKELGVWEIISKDCTTIQSLGLGQKSYFGEVQIHASDYQQPALAYVIAFDKLYKALEQLAKPGINIQKDHKVHNILPDKNGWAMTIQGPKDCIKSTSKRILIADGAQASLAEKLGMIHDESSPVFYSSLRGLWGSSWPKAQCWQRFTKQRVYGVIPGAKQGFGYIITTAQTKEALEIDQAQIQTDFGYRLGTIQLEHERARYQTLLQYRPGFDVPGVLLIGNSQLALPPIGAQGLNQALANVAVLAKLSARESWLQADPLPWQRHYASLTDPGNKALYQGIRAWISTQDSSWWSRIKKTAAWGWLGADHQADTMLFGVGQGVCPSEGLQ
jgi:2-octaprenyl-6-methoxyphenol hydroxylase